MDRCFPMAAGPHSTSRGQGNGVSRRVFMGAAASGLAWAVAPAAWTAAPAFPSPGRLQAPVDAPAAVGARWLDRDPLDAGLASYSGCWHCASSGASLELDTDGVWPDEPGWGRHRFSLAALREGLPQETVRRVFGPTVAEELCQTVEAMLRR
jgi:hypothetical protein